MHIKHHIISFLFLFLFSAAQSQSHEVLISTNLGDIKVKLYDGTPEHAKNFMQLVNSGHFDGTLFYRVIKNFIIQGGSLDSRNAPPGKHIGYGVSTRIINSELNPDYFHKRGALCAPRQPDDINVFKKSDVSQFYIISGRKYTDEELDIIENNHNKPIEIELKKKYYLPEKEKLAELKQTDPEAFNELLREIKNKIRVEYLASDLKHFTDEQRKVYTTMGGVPALDGEYTVFGEVTEGMDVVDKIANLKTDKNDRPYQDVKMDVRVLK
ncbi:peptidylprolyl isomerase [Saccharicrinis sp. FJH54]|uniref:peptidylprolyl isomerase n=1 Tax=Saccharicrinis sp. FJH54 TaxID=3344665 RepID=UPI0035D49957